MHKSRWAILFCLFILAVTAPQFSRLSGQIKEVEDLRLHDTDLVVVPDWTQSTDYITNQVIVNAGIAYRRTVAGTSGLSFTEVDWTDFGIPSDRLITITATASETSVAEAAQDLVSDVEFTVGIADDAVLPGVASMTVPTGTTAQEPAGAVGQIRYDSSTDRLRAFEGSAWKDATDSTSGAVTVAAAATTFAVDSGLMVVTSDAGGNTIATITGGYAGRRVLLLFVDGLSTVTDTNGHTADTVDLSAVFTSADDTVLELVHDGTSWYEIGRSAN